MEVLIQDAHHYILFFIACKATLTDKSQTLQVTSSASPNHCILYFPSLSPN